MEAKMAEGEVVDFPPTALREADVQGQQVEKKLYRLKVVKLNIHPLFHILDEDDNIVGDTNSTPISMWPGKCISFKALVAQLELEANKDQVQIAEMANKPLLG